MAGVVGGKLASRNEKTKAWRWFATGDSMKTISLANSAADRKETWKRHGTVDEKWAISSASGVSALSDGGKGNINSKREDGRKT